MKPFIYMIIFCFVLLSAPVMAAPPNPDPELDFAHDALAAAMETAPAFSTVSCEANSGGSYMARFGNRTGPELIIKAEGGHNPRWEVDNQFVSPASFDGGEFTSKGQGFQPWKKYVKNLCVICMSDLESCLSN